MTTIVRATPDSWNKVREIRLRALTSDPQAFGQSWEQESNYTEKDWVARLDEAVWFLAVDDTNTPIGVVASRHEADSPQNERELQAMWVAPDNRGEGVAKKLIDAVVAWAAEDGADTVTLFIGPRSTRARDIYEMSGFTDTGDRWDVGGDNDAWIKMARSI